MNDAMDNDHPPILITVAELAAQIESPDPPLILDVQWVLGDRQAGRAGFTRGHLPSAQFCDLDSVLSGPVGATGGRHPLPDPRVLEHELRQLGVGLGPVVVYDGGDGSAAARAWWVLRYAGHRDVRILDGGLPVWTAQGNPTDSGPAGPVPPGDFAVKPGAMRVLDAESAAAVVADGVLLDARAEARFQGEVEPIDRVAGHIPGAVSAPTTGNVNADGTYRSPEQLLARFAALGVDRTSTVGAYCGSGVSAAQEVFALRLAGVDAALYVGSWSDWISDPARPIGTGDQGAGRGRTE